jgi:hypothetical protein
VQLELLHEEESWVFSMMQDIDKHHDVEGCIVMRNRIAVELGDRDIMLASDQNIEPRYMNIKALLANLGGKQAITTSNVQDS